MQRSRQGGESVGEGDPLGSRSLAMALRREIEKLILGGGLAAGERLNENLLAERFKVSRGPVREAFRALVEAGLLEFVPNRGVFVRQISLQEAIDAYEVRAALFGLAGRLAATRMAPEEVAKVTRLVEVMEDLIRRRDGTGYYEMNLDLHARILEATGNRRLVATYGNLIKELHLVRAINLENSAHLAASNAEHRDMVEAIAAGDGSAAFESHFRHVMNAKARIVEIGRTMGSGLWEDEAEAEPRRLETQGREHA